MTNRQNEYGKNKLIWGFPNDFLLQVQMGMVPGFLFLDKYGENPLVETTTDPEDIWEGGGLYPFSTTADIVSLSSSDDGDTQDIKLQGLDVDGVIVEQTIALTGQTRVALTTALWRVYRMENEGTTDLAGTVYCYSGTGNDAGVPDSGSVEKARIDNGNNQTLMAIYTVPAGMVGYLMRGEVGINYSTSTPATADQSVRLYYLSRRFGKVFKVKKTISLLTGGTSVYRDIREAPDPIPAKTDIVIRAQEVSSSMGLWATFHLLLVAEGKLSASYLTAIGQPS